jgi:adenosine deaminase
MDEFGYTLQDVARIARNAVDAACLSDERRQAIRAKLDQWLDHNVA